MTRDTFLPPSSSLAFSADLILLAVAHDSEGWCNRGKWKRGYYLNLTATQRDSSLPLWHSTLTSAGGTQREELDKAWLIYRQPLNAHSIARWGHYIMEYEWNIGSFKHKISIKSVFRHPHVVWQSICPFWVTELHCVQYFCYWKQANRNCFEEFMLRIESDLDWFGVNSERFEWSSCSEIVHVWIDTSGIQCKKKQQFRWITTAWSEHHSELFDDLSCVSESYGWTTLIMLFGAFFIFVAEQPEHSAKSFCFKDKNSKHVSNRLKLFFFT